MTRQIYKASRLVCRLTGFVIQPNKAIVGANAFRHESGIHQDGVLKKASTYEIMKPEDVGFTGHKLVLGKHSGRHAFDQHLRSLGFKLSGNQLEKAFSQFKHLADKKKTVYDEDLVAIVEDEIRDMLEYWHLESLYISCGTQVIPTATVSLKTKEGVFKMSSIGDGPVDATYKAIEKIVGIKAELQDYRLEAVTKGKDAVGEVAVKLKVKSQVVIGRGVSTDIIEASAKAYLNAINKSLLPYKRI
jgi:2-isopropylmalate synthase